MPKSPLDHAMDLLVYAPVGFAVAARDALPDLIDKGRQQLGGQVSTARMMGQMAVAQGQREADKAIAQVWERLAGLKLFAEGGPPSPPPKAGEAPTAPSRAESPAQPVPGPSVTAEDLAIPGYDSLSAPQVVQRLAGLSSEELELVRQYEAGTRHRKTILTRISQLQPPQP